MLNLLKYLAAICNHDSQSGGEIKQTVQRVNSINGLITDYIIPFKIGDIKNIEAMEDINIAIGIGNQ